MPRVDLLRDLDAGQHYGADPDQERHAVGVTGKPVPYGVHPASH